MSTEQAEQFIQRLMTDTDFREQLESAPPEQRREIIVSEGFGDVRLRHLSQTLPETSGGELTDEEFASIAGGMHKSDLIAWQVTAATGGFAAAVVGVIAAA